jgi:hypothetical protein
MLLILADDDDGLACAVARCARQSALDVMMCGNAALAEPDEEDAAVEGMLCDGSYVSLAEVEGVLYRMRTSGREGAEGMSRNGIAAWYTTLWNLPCPVANRFALSWWLDPAGYSAQLVRSLNAVLATAGGARGRRTDTATVIMAGSKYLPAGGGDRLAARWLNGCASALARWQRETGVTLARLTLQGNRVAALDPCPAFGSMSADLTDKTAEAVCSAYSRDARTKF